MATFLAISKFCKTPVPPRYEPCGEPATYRTTSTYIDTKTAQEVRRVRSACFYHSDENAKQRAEDWYANHPMSMRVVAWDKYGAVWKNGLGEVEVVGRPRIRVEGLYEPEEGS